jgi:hypothetical protein
MLRLLTNNGKVPDKIMFLVPLLLPAVFITAAIAKIFAFDEFQGTLAASRLLPVAVVHIAASAIIVVEFCGPL